MVLWETDCGTNSSHRSFQRKHPDIEAKLDKTERQNMDAFRDELLQHATRSDSPVPEEHSLPSPGRQAALPGPLLYDHTAFVQPMTALEELQNNHADLLWRFQNLVTAEQQLKTMLDEATAASM